MSKTNVGLNAMYNGGLTHGFTPAMRGGGIMSSLKKAHDWAKKNQVISRFKQASDDLGATGFLDRKTNGQFSNLTNFAKSRGYGRRRRVGRPRKAGCGKRKSGSKTAKKGGRYRQPFRMRA